MHLKPPHWFTRLPGSIRERPSWKARKQKWWILFYAAPCLDGILDDIYRNHLCRLLGAVQLLWKDSITQCDVRNAMDKLSDFVVQMEDLYGKGAMTFNVHQLL
ncbi:hypothetical protein HPB48_009588 [Haemaphysalis longicornis]|uniref:Uncharacterized protein n=1 Tax=Haemaphysalis longicornis TaxID=44386 RepID=A0A9J6F6S6_HAELO|nr:hypothetical protein HPB48_009588 [Haemaphysalis longicornis]